MNNFLLIIVIYFLSVSCDGQINKKVETAKKNNCNQEVYGTKKYIKDLPEYICIPKGYIIDDFIRMSDIDHDGINDFIAVKYNKREEDQEDGDTTYWSFYELDKKYSIYKLRYTLNNIVPPYFKSVSLQYLANNPKAEQIFNTYPRRVLHKFSFMVEKDMIKLSYKLDDVFGKSFVFKYRNSNWYMEEVEYFIGELPQLWWRNNEFYYPLRNDFLIIERIKPKINVTIDHFDLIEAFKYRELEVSHLSEWHIDNLDESKTKTIKDAELGKCNGISLPGSWKY